LRTRLLLCRVGWSEGGVSIAATARSVSDTAHLLEREYAFGVVRQLFEPVLRTRAQPERTRLLSRRASPAADVLDLGDAGAISGTDRLARVIHGLYWLALNLASDRPLLILIDDAQWADPPSLRFLSYLAGRLDGSSVLAVVAVRRGDGRPTDDALVAVTREETRVSFN
jgi:hypothetical protein